MTNTSEALRPPLPPFTFESATQKVRIAKDAWTSRDPSPVALAYSTQSEWRNWAEFLTARRAIEAFLSAKWSKDLDPIASSCGRWGASQMNSHHFHRWVSDLCQ